MIALLFPGQGAQYPGMLANLAETPGARELVDRASEILARDLVAIDGARDAYRSTIDAQCALFVAGSSCARALAAAGVRIDAMAGHSVGAFAAAVACGALDFDDALRAVDLRGRAMADAFGSDGYGMGAIGGLTRRAIDALVARVHTERAPVYATNVNAPGQVAISGASTAVDDVLALARESGARSTRRLDVVVPAHSPLMHDVAESMRVALARLPFARPRVGYVTNASARFVRDADAIRRDLSESIARPVEWANATRVLYERGVRTFIETRPGSTLATLANDAFPDARTVTMETIDVASVAYGAAAQNVATDFFTSLS